MLSGEEVVISKKVEVAVTKGSEEREREFTLCTVHEEKGTGESEECRARIGSGVGLT